MHEVGADGREPRPDAERGGERPGRIEALHHLPRAGEELGRRPGRLHEERAMLEPSLVPDGGGGAELGSAEGRDGEEVEDERQAQP